jgi:predicted nucleic acid-binding protein
VVVELVDTSAWVELFRRSGMVTTLDLDEAVTCLPIVQEVLQGFQDDRAYRLARGAMLALPIVESPLRRELFEEAADLYRAVRRSGRTVRSSVDCLIAACAMRHDLTVVHHDRDYEVIAAVSRLRTRRLRAGR